jgi:hypothetical protein
MNNPETGKDKTEGTINNEQFRDTENRENQRDNK